MREKGKAMGLITDVDRLIRKRLDPKGHQTIEDLGIGEILDMTDQIRAVLKDKPMSGINYGHKLILEKYK